MQIDSDLGFLVHRNSQAINHKKNLALIRNYRLPTIKRSLKFSCYN